MASCLSCADCLACVAGTACNSQIRILQQALFLHCFGAVAQSCRSCLIARMQHVSLRNEVMIGCVTIVIGDLASLLGCSMNVRASKCAFRQAYSTSKTWHMQSMPDSWFIAKPLRSMTCRQQLRSWPWALLCSKLRGLVMQVRCCSTSLLLTTLEWGTMRQRSINLSARSHCKRPDTFASRTAARQDRGNLYFLLAVVRPSMARNVIRTPLWTPAG